MGLISLSTIILSLICLAMIIGLVCAVILIWPHKTPDHPDSQMHESSQSERPPSDQE
jgi:energy-converting hydrogenase Eha subunit A